VASGTNAADENTSRNMTGTAVVQIDRLDGCLSH
jgi:hypothetical protein